MYTSKILVTLGPALNSVKDIEDTIYNGAKGFRLHLGSIQRNNVGYFMNVLQAKANPGARPRTIKETQDMIYNLGDKVRFVDYSNLSFNNNTSVIRLYDFSRYIYNMRLGDVLEFRGGKLVFSIVEIDLVNEYIDTITIKAEKKLKALNVGTLKHSYVDYYPLSTYDIELIKEMKRNQLIPDYVALSFCTCTEQIKLFREIVNDEFGSNVKCFAKIENGKGLWCSKEIVSYVDGIFIARADISNNIPFMHWANVQEQLVNIAHNHKKELCIGSGFLSYFSKNCVINRGEIIDVNIALENRADWIMLSGETGNSPYSIETIKVLNSIINPE